MLTDETHPDFPTHLQRVYSREQVETRDGWRLTLHRVRPVQSRSAIPIPVVLVHGHANSAWIYFAGPGGGIAGNLAAAGRDVWAVELRGSQQTSHRNGSASVRISDKLGIDLPTLFGHVTRRARSPKVDAVGHSIGGTLLCLGALSDPAWPVRRAVVLASPLRIPRRAVPGILRGRAARLLAGCLGRVPLSGLVARLSDRFEPTWMPVHFHPDNAEERVFRAFLRSGMTDVYGSELTELLAWIHRGDHRTLLPAGTLLRRPRLETPTRFLVGSEDRLSPPDAVRRSWQIIGSPRCEFVEIGRRSGFQRDYRHLDLLLGSRAQRDVTPLIVDWLERDLGRAAWRAAV